MPHEIDTSRRRKVAKLWIQGFTYDQIVEKVGVSYNSVRNILDELKAGRYPEFASFRDQLEQLRSLNQQLHSNDLSLIEAVVGLDTFNALIETGIDPRKLNETLGLLKKLAPPDFPIKSFIQAGLRTIELETTSGVPFEHLPIQYERLVNDVKELQKCKSGLEEAKRTAEKELQEKVKEKGTTIQALDQFAKERRTLEEAGLGVADLTTAVEFIRKAKSEGALDSAKDLFNLESQTGRNYSTFLEEYRQALALSEKCKLEATRWKDDARRMELEIAGLEQERQRELAENQVATEILSSYLAILERLTGHGIDFAQLGKLSTVLDELEKCGWNPNSIISYLQTIDSLESKKRQVQAELLNTQLTLSREEDNLKNTRNSIATKTSELKSLLAVETQRRQNLTRLEQHTAEEQFQSELSQALLPLLTDPSKVTDSQLDALTTLLQATKKARGEGHGLPIDYEQLRQKALLVVENAWGKQLVLKETADNQQKLLREKNQELLFDRARKIASERIRLERAKADLDSEEQRFASEKKNFEEASTERLLAIAARRFREGSIQSCTCQSCGSAFAYQPGAKRSTPICCPFCLLGSLRQRNKFPEKAITASS